MGPLPRSNKGHRFILTVADLFSKFSLSSSKAPFIVKAVDEYVCLIIGVPCLLLCDSDIQFTSKIFGNLINNYEVEVGYNHPQANPTELFNRTLKIMLAAYVTDNHRHWDVNLAKVN